jgi:hypothetical protein
MFNYQGLLSFLGLGCTCMGVTLIFFYSSPKRKYLAVDLDGHSISPIQRNGQSQAQHIVDAVNSSEFKQVARKFSKLGVALIAMGTFLQIMAMNFSGDR